MSEYVKATLRQSLGLFAPEDLTPVEKHGRVWLKRDDLFTFAGVSGGKVRSCLVLVRAALDSGAEGVITAGSRNSPQVEIVARVADALGVPCRVHVPAGAQTEQVANAELAGAEVVRHRPAYNNVLTARARADAEESGWVEIPFGMECAEAVRQTALQTKNLPRGAKRLVVPLGSGMTASGILTGLGRRSLPVLGVKVGAEPTKRLDHWAPTGWQDRLLTVRSPFDYHKPCHDTVGGVLLDYTYEAKCVQFLESGDVLWVVGLRGVRDGD